MQHDFARQICGEFSKQVQIVLLIFILKMKFIFLLNIALLMQLQLSCASATNYCASNLCKAGKQHIACNNNGKFGKNCSADAQMISLNPYVDTILMAHNVRRNKLARGLVHGYLSASRMATMQWNNELAYLAALNVRQCVMEHDECRNTNIFPRVGQNLAIYGYNNYSEQVSVDWIIRNRINAWWQEHAIANMTVMNQFPTNYNESNFSHFTTMAAERNTHVGCGLARYSLGEFKVHLFACNYATTNFVGRPVYTAGNMVSACRTGRNHVFSALCSSAEIYRNIKLYKYH